MFFSKKNKKAPHDFNETMLPTNRRQAFFDGIKQRYDVFIKCGLIMLLCAIPYIAVSVWGDIAYAGILKTLADTETMSTIFTLRLTLSLIIIPCFAIIGLGCAAVSRLQRQIIWGEPVFFHYHLKLGVKQNALRFVILFTLYGGMKALATYLSILFFKSFLSVIPTAIVLVFFAPIGLYMLSQTVYYNVSFFRSFLNGFLFYIKTGPITLLFLLILFILSLTELIPYFIIKPIALSIVFFLIPLFSFAWLQYSCHFFDRYINPTQYPQYTKKGLYNPKKQS